MDAADVRERQSNIAGELNGIWVYVTWMMNAESVVEKSCHRLKGPSASDRCHAGASPLGSDNVSPRVLVHWTYLHVACTRDQGRAKGTSCLAAMCIILHLDLDDFIYARALFRRFLDLLFWSFLGKIMYFSYGARL